MISKLYRWIFGYVVFEGTCNYPAKLMNIISKEKLNIWDVTCKNLTVKGCIKKSDYGVIHDISKITGLHVHITSKHGLPFLLNKHKLHIGIPIGAVLFISILFVLSMFLWRIEITETANVKAEAIETAMQNYGVYPGVLIHSINTELLEQQLTQSINNISWISVNIQGCVIKVELKERISPPKIEQNNQVSNLVASVDGQIIRNEVFSGNCVVKAGEVVTQGQILVNGIFEDSKGNKILKRSTGKIYANTLHKVTESTPFTIVKKTYLPDSYIRKSMKFFNFTLPFRFSNIPTENCDVYITKEKENIIGTSIPIEFYSETFYPYEEQNIKLTMDQATDILKTKLKKYEETELKDAIILKKKENYLISNNEYTAEVIYECEENIAQEQIVANDLEEDKKTSNKLR